MCRLTLVRALHTNDLGRDKDICIGQGWRGKSFDGLGIGNCCSGAEDCVTGCPPLASAIVDKLND